MIVGDVRDDPRRGFAVEVVARLREAGHEALWAGGCVRDLILGGDPADYDVATNARPEAVMKLFRRTVPVGVSFGVVRVLGPSGAGEVEVATFRSDGAYEDGRRPESVTFGSAEADAARRDFTINGMFLDPISGDLIDFVGGREDLQAGLLRAIGDPEARFAEDKLRLLRAVRFASRFGLVIEPNTHAAIVAMAPQVVQVSAERIAKELRGMLAPPSRARSLNLAMEIGLVAAIWPELAALKRDDWDRTLRVLEALPADASFPLAMAALLQGIGNPRTSGPTTADHICRDLKLSNSDREQVVWLVGQQAALIEPQKLREARFKRLLASPDIRELLALHRALAVASTGSAPDVEYCEWYLRDQPSGPIDPPPLLDGNDLRQQGWRPGPRFKALLDQARDEQLERRIDSKEAALRWLEGQPR